MRKFINLVVYQSISSLVSESKKSYLSFLWWIFEPALAMLTYYYVFGILLNLRTEQFISYLMIGVVTWNWFYRTVSNCATSVLNSGNIISKIQINKTFFPLTIILSDFIKFVFVLVILMSFLYLQGDVNVETLWFLPILVMSELLLIIGISFWVSFVVPFLPDLAIVTNTFLLALMFASGIFYSVELIPPSLTDIFYLNPMAYIISCYRNIFLDGELPDSLYFLKMNLFFIVVIISSIIFVKSKNNQYIKLVIK